MKIYEAKNSLLIFTQIVDESLSIRLLNHIYQGVKVFLFTTDSLENYENNPTWVEAKKYGLFYWTEVPFSEGLPESEKAFLDGTVSDRSLYEHICKKTSFNRQQYEIEHVNAVTNIIVSAGAGTGKTTVMIDRLLFLKHTNTTLSFSEMVLITFTNEAAVHMRRKLAERLLVYFKVTGQKRYIEWLEESQKLQISTIHSFAKRFLETAGPELGFPSSLSLRSFRFEKRRMIERFIDDYSLQFPEDYRALNTIPQYLIVDMAMHVNAVLENKSIHSEKIVNQMDFGTDNRKISNLLHFLISKLHEELPKIKAQEYNWEISDLIRHLDRLPGLPNLQEKMPIRYMMVDEFQDTDAVQVQFLLWLFDQLRFQLFVVGDEKQSIYRFRGADYTAFRQLELGLRQRCTQVEHKFLVKNYRTTAKLLTRLNMLFQHWGERVAKFQFSFSDILEPTVHDENGSAGMELFTTKGKLKEVLKSIINSDTAILVRSNQDVQTMITWCLESGFFCEGAVRGNFYRTEPVQEFYIMIRALISQNSYREFYSLHRSSYGANTLSNYTIFNSYNSEREYLQELYQDQPDWVRWQEYRAMATRYPALQITTRIVEERNPALVYASRKLHRLKQKHPEQDHALQIKEATVSKTEYELNLDYLLYLIQKHFSDTVVTLHRIEKFLRLHMQTDNEEIPLNASEEDRKHRFKCMTVHKAKGLEFDHVILPVNRRLFLSDFRSQVLLQEDGERLRVGYHLNIKSDVYRNDFFGQIRGTENDEIIAEETRLLYVAMTRARKSIFARLDDLFAPSYTINSWGDLLKVDQFDVQS